MDIFKRYSRQIVLKVLGIEGQKKLSESSVVVLGCGALGTTAAMLMARLGIGKLRVVDRDFIEIHNLHRQILYDEDDVKKGVPKAVACAEKLRKINSTIEVEEVVDDINSRNIEKLIKDVDLAIDGLDNFETRFVVNDAVVKLRKPWIYASALSTYGMTMNIVPGETPCLRDLIQEAPPPGLIPTCEVAGILNTTTTIVSAYAVTEAIKILTGKPYSKGELLIIDPWSRDYEKIKVEKRGDCPACVRGEFEYLEGKGARLVSLCGRNAIQITPEKETKLNLGELAKKLSVLGEVRLTKYILYFNDGSYEMAIFPNGRSIIKGTTDEKIAKALYSKYIGL